jgi:hypothetical protein
MRPVGCATVNFPVPEHGLTRDLEVRAAPEDSVTSRDVIRLKAAIATNAATSRQPISAAWREGCARTPFGLMV